MSSNTIVEVDARLAALRDISFLPLAAGVTRRAAIRALTELIPALVADMHDLDDVSDPGDPLPRWMRSQLDLLRTEGGEAVNDCSHGMPSRSSCVDCMVEGPAAAPAAWRKVGRPKRAEYEATCMCGDEILVGDSVQRWEFGTDSAYLHERCTIR